MRTIGVRVVLAVAVLGTCLAVTSGCRRRGGAGQTLTLAGSTAFQPFAAELADEYMDEHPRVLINVQGGGSMHGIQAVTSGAAQIGMVDLVELPEEATKMHKVEVARDGIAVVVHPDNPVQTLTMAHVRGIFDTSITNWKEVGGRDKTINVISREEASGTRRSFEELLMKGTRISPSVMVQDSSGTVREAVATGPDAIGYLSICFVDRRVKALALDGVPPTNKNVLAGTYPLVRPMWLLMQDKPTGLAKAFIEFLLSPKAQAELAREGLIPAERP